jgi:hypothetical protein
MTEPVLRMQCKLTAIQAKINAQCAVTQAMMSANKVRQINGFTDAYGETSFLEVAEALETLAEEAHNLSTEELNFLAQEGGE